MLLNIYKRGEPVPRGTIQTDFLFKEYYELKKQGFCGEFEELFRQYFPDGDGLLQAEKVLPKGPADNVLKTGDILLALNGNLVTKFVDLESVMDKSVGKSINLHIWRNKQVLSVTCIVQDSHSITPNWYVEIGDSVYHNLSHRLANSFGLPIEGIFVAKCGYLLSQTTIERYNIITKVNYLPTTNIEDFIEIIKELPEGANVPINYFDVEEKIEKTCLVRMKTQWHPFNKMSYQYNSPEWVREDLRITSQGRTKKSDSTDTSEYSELVKGSGSSLSEPLKHILPCSVYISVSYPFAIDGCKDNKSEGMGVVIDAAQGLILCDRSTILTNLCDINVTFRKLVTITAKVRFCHPCSNFAIIQYDTKEVKYLDIQSIKIEYENNSSILSPDDEVYAVGMTKTKKLISNKTKIQSCELLDVDPDYESSWISRHCEVLKFENDSWDLGGGIICTESGIVKGMLTKIITKKTCIPIIMTRKRLYPTNVELISGILFLY